MQNMNNITDIINNQLIFFCLEPFFLLNSIPDLLVEVLLLFIGSFSFSCCSNSS